MRQYCRQISSRAHTTHGQARWQAIDLLCMFCHPANGAIALFEPGGKFILRGQTIGDRDNEPATLVGQTAAQRVLCLQVAHDASAAVEIDQHGEWTNTSRNIDSKWQCTQRTGDAALKHLCNWFHFTGFYQLPQRLLSPPDALRGHTARQREIDRIETCQQALGLRIKGHGATPLLVFLVFRRDALERIPHRGTIPYRTRSSASLRNTAFFTMRIGRGVYRFLWSEVSPGQAGTIN